MQLMTDGQGGTQASKAQPRPPHQWFHGVRNAASELGAAVIAVALALLIVAAFIKLIGNDPVEAYGALLRGSLGTRNGFAETLVRATPLLLAGLGTAIAFRCGLWNIGAEGQIYMGALGAALAGLYLPPMPIWLHLPIVLAAGLLFGGLWAALPGYFKATRKTNEIITTLMMNYLAIGIVGYLVSGPIKDPNLLIPQPQTATLPITARLPVLIPHTRAHFGVLLALAAAGLVYWLLWRTSLGYEIKSVGANPQAARYGGINVARNMMLAMAFSGALAGLAGAGEVAGVHGFLLDGISPGYGNLAIAVALLGGLHPVGIVVSSFLFGALMVGADAMQRATGVPSTTVYFIEGLVLIFVLARSVLLARRAR